MRAVNLLPESARRSSGLTASHVLLGLLGFALLLVTVATLTDRQVSGKRAELERVRAEATAAEGRTKALSRYTAFADLRAKRVETVTSLVKSRFDWAGSLREVSRTIPAGTSLNSLRGTVQPGVAVEGQSDPLRAALPVPAFELQGCTTSQDSVARMMTAMRQISGVQRVSLSSSEKGEGGGGDAGCSADQPVFSMTVFFKAPAGAAAGAAQAGGQGAGAGAKGAAASGSTTTTASAAKGATP
jgi:Tfp pilus assembly protein PilN